MLATIRGYVIQQCNFVRQKTVAAPGTNFAIEGIVQIIIGQYICFLGLVVSRYFI